MLEQIYRGAELLAALGAVSSMAFYTLCSWGAVRFLSLRAAGKGTRFTPPPLPSASILKPLKGTDPAFYENLRSHCLQDYPQYEIIFGVSDPADPAIAAVKRLQSEFPERSIQLVVCARDLGANTKVSNLVQMLPYAHGQHLVVNDSDIRVAPDYLRQVVPPLSDPKVGLVTCLYRAIAGPTLGSRFEALGISTDFIPGVLAARQIEEIRFGLGSTLAFRRQDLQSIGGFEALVDHLADDYEIGNRIAATGLRVLLSESVVETFLPPYTFAEFLRHQLRWGRTIRDSRRWGYFGLVFTFGLPWAVLGVVLAGGAAWAWTLLATTALSRLGMALIVGAAVVEDRQVLSFLWLIPIRDLISPLLWLASLVGHHITWRDKSFILKDGKLERIGS